MALIWAHEWMGWKQYTHTYTALLFHWDCLFFHKPKHMLSKYTERCDNHINAFKWDDVTFAEQQPLCPQEAITGWCSVALKTSSLGYVTETERKQEITKMSPGEVQCVYSLLYFHDSVYDMQNIVYLWKAMSARKKRWNVRNVRNTHG